MSREDVLLELYAEVFQIVENGDVEAWRTTQQKYTLGTVENAYFHLYTAEANANKCLKLMQKLDSSISSAGIARDVEVFSFVLSSPISIEKLLSGSVSNFAQAVSTESMEYLDQKDVTRVGEYILGVISQIRYLENRHGLTLLKHKQRSIQEIDNSNDGLSTLFRGIVDVEGTAIVPDIKKIKIMATILDCWPSAFCSSDDFKRTALAFLPSAGEIAEMASKALFEHDDNFWYFSTLLAPESSVSSGLKDKIVDGASSISGNPGYLAYLMFILGADKSDIPTVHKIMEGLLGPQNKQSVEGAQTLMEACKILNNTQGKDGKRAFNNVIDGEFDTPGSGCHILSAQ